MDNTPIIYLKKNELREIIREELRAGQPQEKDFKSEKMTVGEGANYIGVSYATLCKWITQKKIPVHGKGRNRFLYRSELIRAFEDLDKSK